MSHSTITIDCQLTMKDHVRRTCTACFYQLRQLRVVRRSLSSDACASLVHAFILSRLDYCNSLLAGISDTLIRQLQSVLHVAASLVTRRRKYDPISEIITTSLTGCLFDNKSTSKLGVLVYKHPAQSGSSLPNGDGTTRVTHSRTAYASFICSQRYYRAKDRACSVRSSRFLERWTLTLEQSSN